MCRALRCAFCTARRWASRSAFRVALWRAFTTARWCDFFADFLAAFFSAFFRARAWAFALAFFFVAALAVALAVASAPSFAVDRCFTTTWTVALRVALPSGLPFGPCETTVAVAFPVRRTVETNARRTAAWAVTVAVNETFGWRSDVWWPDVRWSAADAVGAASTTSTAATATRRLVTEATRRPPPARCMSELLADALGLSGPDRCDGAPTRGRAAGRSEPSGATAQNGRPRPPSTCRGA